MTTSSPAFSPTISPLSSLAQITPPSAAGVRLQDWGVIQAQGDDARSFLHGQLTQDVLGLPPDRWRSAGFCSAKGRLLATFWMASPERDTAFLACSRDLLPTVLKRLSMFVLRAKCKLSDVSDQRPLFGVVGAWSASPQPGHVLSQDRGLAWGLASVEGQDRALWMGAEPDAAPEVPLSGDAAGVWSALEVASGVARVVVATAEQFVPQMVNLEATHGVNFQKGCYPGQEVVARSQYRGTLKRRMVRMASERVLAPGAEVLHSTDPAQPAGMVVLSAATPAGAVHLVEIKLEALTEAGQLSASGQTSTTLNPALPYELPAQA